MTDEPAIAPAVRAILDEAGMAPTSEELMMFSMLVPVLRARAQAIYTVELTYDQI